ncbi:MAG: mechanosensitive ion channel [Oscillospiraceae bacterium]|nr:mechanosensitive ion channel [Oscillospiraceae bacterium]
MESKKKVASFKDVILFELVNRFILAILLFIGQTKVTERAQLHNLRERLDILTATFTKSYTETQELTDIYDAGMQAKADSLVLYLDHTGGFAPGQLREIRQLYDVDEIIIGEGSLMEMDEAGYLYYTRTMADGTKITLKKSDRELKALLNNIYTQNRVLNGIVELDDLFFIVTTSSGEIVYYPDPRFIGENISALGITLDDLSYDNAKWLKIDKSRYYTSSIRNGPLNITISCGIDSAHMTKNSHIRVGILYRMIIIVYTILVAYTYFSKQESLLRKEEIRKDREFNGVKEDIARFRLGERGGFSLLTRKMITFSFIGMVLVFGVSYYVQTLFAISLNNLDIDNEQREIITKLDEAENSVTKLVDNYNDRYLNEANIISYMLSRHPEMREKAYLSSLSKIFDLEYIMLFDKDGVETLSDSPIFGFVISDDPTSQSYAFNVLKHGIPYVIQEPMEDDLTGTYHQFIGVPLTDTQGEYDGFMQIAVAPEKLREVVAEADLNNVLNGALLGSNDYIIAINKNTLKVDYSNFGKIAGKPAVEAGFKENQIKNGYYGHLAIDGVRLYGDSFEYKDHLIYVVERATNTFSGRMTMTLFTLIVTMANFIGFSIFIHSREVLPVYRSDNDPYVEVTMANGVRKRTPSIMFRILRSRTSWQDKSREEKTGYVLNIVISLIAISLLFAYIFRDTLYTQDTIFGFMLSEKWDRGLNVFALTEVMVFVALYSLAMNVFNKIMNTVIAYSTPRYETIFRLLMSFVHYIGIMLVIFRSLYIFGFDTASLLASAGLMTLIIGLGSRDLITDILAGLFIIFEREYQVGDIIEVNGWKGRVIEIGLRTTKLINQGLDIKSINNHFMTGVVNKTRNNSYVDIILSVGNEYKVEDIERMLAKELPKITEKSPYIISGPSNGGMDTLDRTMKFSIRTECSEEHKFEVRTTVNRELKKIFEDYDVKLS